jgi:hypothetical protein
MTGLILHHSGVARVLKFYNAAGSGIQKPNFVTKFVIVFCGVHSAMQITATTGVSGVQRRPRKCRQCAGSLYLSDCIHSIAGRQKLNSSVAQTGNTTLTSGSSSNIGTLNPPASGSDSTLATTWCKWSSFGPHPGQYGILSLKQFSDRFVSLNSSPSSRICPRFISPYCLALIRAPHSILCLCSLTGAHLPTRYVFKHTHFLHYNFLTALKPNVNATLSPEGAQTPVNSEGTSLCFFPLNLLTQKL